MDLACLGVKSAFASLFGSTFEYESELRDPMFERQELEPADINLVAKIIREGIAYAKSLGFNPDPDYRDAMILLNGADPDACPIEIPLGGEDGNPFFIAGPYDNVSRIMAKLERAVGRDGFTFIVPMFPADDLDLYLDDDFGP